ncbi:MAG: dihydrofolate reductase [Candidatus Brennerbacteria bacterium]|nr:dihydrofolate reductase [Candidatus Brennerbacteria bacterium]
MIVSIIAAIAENGVIGESNNLPWRLPADLKRFKEITTGHPVIMGRKTHESIGRALPNRKNIIITRREDYSVEGCSVVHSIDEALSLVKDEEEIFFIGGGDIYRQVLPLAHRLYITRIHKEFPGDTRFPEVDFGEWKEVRREKGTVDEKNPYEHEFLIFERKSP